MSESTKGFEAPKQGAIVWALKDRVLLVNTVWGFAGILMGVVDYLSKSIAPLPYVVAGLGVAACLVVFYIYRLPRDKILPMGAMHIIREALGERQLASGEYQYVTTRPGKAAKILVVVILGVTMLIFCGTAFAHAKYKDDGGWVVAWARSIQEDVAAIKADTGEIRNTASRIEKKVEVLKRESSDDPRKELANMGVLWTGDAFYAALKSGDDRVAGLFLQGGKVLEYSGMLEAIIRKDNPKIVKQFLAFHPTVEFPLCKIDLQKLPPDLVLNASESQRSVIKHACSNTETKKYFQSELVSYERRFHEEVAAYEKRKATRVSQSVCVQQLMVNDGRALMDEVRTFNPLANGTISGRSRLLAQIYPELLMRGGPSAAGLRQLVEKYCAEEATVVDDPVDDLYPRRAKKLVAILNG